MSTLQRGAAVVMAMLVVAISVVLVSGTFLRQSAMARQVENEASMVQARCLLEGAVDWVRVILKEDGRTSATDHLGEAWAVSLEQTRVDNETGDPAWVSGAIEDAQAKFNLRNLSSASGPDPAETAVLRRLLEMTGEQPEMADRLAVRIHAAFTQKSATVSREIVLPATLDELRIEDPLERKALAALRPFVTFIPMQSSINANTASAEVLAARFENLSLIDARRLVESRNRAAFRDLSDMAGRLPDVFLGEAVQVAVASQFFLVRGFADYRRIRLQALALLWRHDGKVDIVWTRDVAV
jgi:general secretion pathway protein K